MFPFDWYWIVAGDEAHVYSSKRAAYFANDDTEFLVWSNTFGEPSHIASEAELMAILAEFGI